MSTTPVITSVPLQRNAEGWLTEATVDAIVATMPKCPRCGEGIDKVHYVVTETHQFLFDISGRSGEVVAYGLYDDTLSRAPATKVVNGEDAPLVECENGHQWAEPRLRLRQQSSNSENWEILPVPAAAHAVETAA